MTLSIAVAGAAGRMGRALIRAAAIDQRFRIAGGTSRAGSQATGDDLGALAGVPALGVRTTSNVATAAGDAVVWIDFTTPEATIAALDALAATPVRAAIIGTTGLSSVQEDRIREAASIIAIVRSGNFSRGVHVLAALVRQTAEKLGPDWDIEITDIHHRRKVDAPSGTALMLGVAAAEGRGRTLAELRLPPRETTSGPRLAGGIGFSAVRAGGVVGEHDVRFAAEREVLTLSHQALDRAVFADGALAAALWAARQGPGFYSMAEVLGL